MQYKYIPEILRARLPYSRLMLFLVCLQFICSYACAQLQQPHTIPFSKVITTDFAEKEVLFDKSSIIANVLKIKNNNGKPYKLHIQVSAPKGWHSITDEDKEIEIYPSDSIFVPIRVVPNFSSVSGSTKYTINVAVQSVEGKVMAANFFFAKKPTISNWQMKILPQPRIYFLNDENSANFQVELSNDGDETKNILLSMNTVGNGISVGDSSFRALRKHYTELFLPPYVDTLLPFSVTIEKMKRNQRRLDIEGYVPYQSLEEKNYTLFAKAGEVGNSMNRVEHAQKVDFIKLSNNINFVKLTDNLKLNQYSIAALPMVADLNIYNLLAGTRPLANLNMYGNARTRSDGILAYQLQSNLSDIGGPSPTRQTFGSIGYYTDKGYLQTGNTGTGIYGIQGLSGGVGGGGLGVSAGYYFSTIRRLCAYASEGRSGPFTHHAPNYGAAYQDAITRGIRYAVGYRHSDNGISVRSDIFQATTSLRLGRSQGVYFLAGSATNDFYTSNVKNSGQSYGVGYNGSFFKRKLTSDINLTNFDKNYTGTGLGNLTGSASTFLRTKGRWYYSLQNQYSAYDNYYTINGSQQMGQNKILFNQLNMNRRSEGPFSMGYFLYYNYTDFVTVRVDGKGVGINGNYFKAKDNFRVQMLLKGGFNRQFNPGLSRFFSIQYYNLINYHTFYFNLNYSYSSISAENSSSANTLISNYPQQILLSASHQLQLGRQIIWENNLSYNYLSSLKKNGLGAYSTLYFYSYSGWRFKLEAGYNRTSSQSFKYDYVGAGSAPILTPTDERVVSKGFQLNVGIRKQFGIPIPGRFAKQKFCNAHFVAFLDLNGNKIMDNDEVPLENVVIRLNDNEVLTNKNGEASFDNALWGRYHLQAFSLVDVGAWFPVTSDSVDLGNVGKYFVPFSKGVKILGNVEIQREKYSGELYSLDLSKIKIMLNDSTGRTIMSSITDNKGNFSFYAPYGNYVLTMDEDILSSNFTIAQNNISVELLDGMDNFYYTFFILENKRRVTRKKFGANGELISENTDIADIYTGGNGNKKDSLNDKAATTANKQTGTANNSEPLKDTVALFKRDEQKVAKIPKPSAEYDKLKDIDSKINRLDSVGNVLLKHSASGFYPTAGMPGTGTSRLPSQSPDVRKMNGFTIEVAYYPSGDNTLKKLYSGMASKDMSVLLDGINSGELKWYFHPDGGTSIIYGCFTHKQDAYIKRSNLLKMGYPGTMKIKVIKQSKLMNP